MVVDSKKKSEGDEFAPKKKKGATKSILKPNDTIRKVGTERNLLGNYPKKKSVIIHAVEEERKSENKSKQSHPSGQITREYTFAEEKNNDEEDKNFFQIESKTVVEDSEDHAGLSPVNAQPANDSNA